MAYRIDPLKDWPLAEEFRLNPIGHHSPNLMRVLNAMRFDPSGYQVILVNRVPCKEWVLGTMPPDRADAIEIREGPVYFSREDAEWAVFCARWHAHTGRWITTPRDISLPEDGAC